MESNKLDDNQMKQLNDANTTFIKVVHQPSENIECFIQGVKIALNNWARTSHSILRLEGEVANFEITTAQSKMKFVPLNPAAALLNKYIETGFSSTPQAFTDIIKHSMRDTPGKTQV